jgi:hypothetical protein
VEEIARMFLSIHWCVLINGAVFLFSVEGGKGKAVPLHAMGEEVLLLLILNLGR